MFLTRFQQLVVETFKHNTVAPNLVSSVCGTKVCVYIAMTIVYVLNEFHLLMVLWFIIHLSSTTSSKITQYVLAVVTNFSST